MFACLFALASHTEARQLGQQVWEALAPIHSDNPKTLRFRALAFPNHEPQRTFLRDWVQISTASVFRREWCKHVWYAGSKVQRPGGLELRLTSKVVFCILAFGSCSEFGSPLLIVGFFEHVFQKTNQQ